MLTWPRLFPILTGRIMTYPWVTDEVTRAESVAMVALSVIAAEDAEFANELASLPWLADEVTEAEGRTLLDLNDIASIDVELAQEVAILPWFTDGMTAIEGNALHRLNKIASSVNFSRRVSGTIHHAFDYDYFSFNARKDEVYSFDFYGDF